MGSYSQQMSALTVACLSSLLVEPRRPADAPMSSGDGKPMLQIWGLGTLSRSQTTVSVPKVIQT